MKNVVKFLVVFAIIIISVIIIYNKEDELIVCIDAGHGGYDVGAVNENRYEKNDNLTIANLVRNYLEENGIKTIMTRDNDTSVSLRQRCIIANKKEADIFVSIHRNSSEAGKGVEIWTSRIKNKNDMNLANSILDKLVDTDIQENRGVKSGTAKGGFTDYYVLKNTKMPSCLVELGFISNDKDNELFDKNIESYAKAIADGIIEVIKDELDGR